jgi:hypothetical protein
LKRPLRRSKVPIAWRECKRPKLKVQVKSKCQISMAFGI